MTGRLDVAEHAMGYGTYGSASQRAVCHHGAEQGAMRAAAVAPAATVLLVCSRRRLCATLDRAILWLRKESRQR